MCAVCCDSGVAERVDYAPGTGPLLLFPAARLQACSSDERCPGVTRIQAAVTLQASRAGSGCDRDTYSLHSQKSICGNYNTFSCTTSCSLNDHHHSRLFITGHIACYFYIRTIISLRLSVKVKGEFDSITTNIKFIFFITGLDRNTVDLLPNPGAGNEWAKSLKPDSGLYHNQGIAYP